MNYSVAFSAKPIMEKIPPGSPVWKDFNASFVNLDVDMGGIMTFVYRGYAMTTQHKNKWRATENYIKGQHIGLDFDSEDAASRLETLAADKFVQKYAAFIHTTISHTPEAPRARVMFLLDAPIMQAKNYTLASSALLWVFGTADRQCKDAVRFFYGSPGCEFVKIGKVLPLEVVKKLIEKYIESGANERKKSVRPNYLPPASQQEVAEALKYIPPWGIPYDEWVAVLMGIHSQFGDAGYQLAESWADGKPGEVDHKWRSFDRTGNEAGAVTIATVFGIAKQHGWAKNGI